MTESLFNTSEIPDYFSDDKILESKPKKKGFSRGSAEIMIRKSHGVYRRAFSETVFFELMDNEKLKDGYSYHFMTGGDIDGLTYLKGILRKTYLDYVMVSTWCMASEDIYQIRDWLENGRIKKIDIYVGEIFTGTYKKEMALLKQVFNQYHCGRICVFKNHSKIMAGTGKDFSFFVESSANLNTNPRNENGCITIDHEGFLFYKNYFDNITSFEKLEYYIKQRKIREKGESQK